MTYISVRPERFSHDLIRASGEFAVNLPTKSLVRAVDFCGVRSGKTVDKFAHCGLTALPAAQISAPIIGESPVSLECRVEQVLSLGSHDMFIAKILCIDVDESVVDQNGKLCLEKAGLLAYAHGTYYELGKALGTFGYTVQKKKKRKKKPSSAESDK